MDLANAVLFACAALVSAASLTAAFAIGSALARVDDASGKMGIRHWSLSLGAGLSVLSCMLAAANLVSELKVFFAAPFFNLALLVLMAAALMARREFQSSWDRWLETEKLEGLRRRSDAWLGASLFLSEAGFLLAEARRFLAATIFERRRTLIRMMTLIPLAFLIAAPAIPLVLEITGKGATGEFLANVVAAFAAPVFLFAIVRRLANLDAIARQRQSGDDNSLAPQIPHIVAIRGASTAGDPWLWLAITMAAAMQIAGSAANGFGDLSGWFSTLFAVSVLILNASIFWFELTRSLNRLVDVAMTSGFDAGRSEPALFIDQAAHRMNNLLMPVRFVISELIRFYTHGAEVVRAISPKLYDFHVRRLHSATETLRLLDDWRNDLRIRAGQHIGQGRPHRWVRVDKLIEALVMNARGAAENRKQESGVSANLIVAYIDRAGEAKWSLSFKPVDAGDGWDGDFEVPSIPVEIKVDPSAFEDVVANLISNAFDAVERRFGEHVDHKLTDGPVIELVVQRIVPDTPFAISVRDNGGGISNSVAARLFMPYATTNIERPGGGLGLFMSKRAVAALGGSLDYETWPEQGTRFIVRLPQALVRVSAS